MATNKGEKEEQLYTVREIPMLYYLLTSKTSKKRDITYIEVPAAFDIETTTISEQVRDDYTDPEVYDYLKSCKILYNDSLARNVPGFSAIRRRNFKNFSKKEGLPPDVLYQELNEWRPDLFPEDIINPADQVVRFVNILEYNRPEQTEFKPFAFMYHWQFCIGEHVTFGRTWEEFKDLINQLEDRMNLDNKHRLVIWCHNLRFEAQFMLPFLKLIGGFWREEREPLKLEIDGGIEFRDSLALSNMSLYKWGIAEGIEHIKDEAADFDYNKIRYPDTPLSGSEISYCYNDVRGLCECISNYMKTDTLASMPMTSTGFVRRAVRSEMAKNKNNRSWFTSSALDVKTYPLMKEAFRGGDTHGNAVYANTTMHDVYSIDIASSYPSQLCMQLFPIGKFRKISAKRFLSGSTRQNYFHILTIVLENPRYVGTCGDPYIPYSKTFNRVYDDEPVVDNGRILRWSGKFSMVVTCVDYDIIMSEYKADAVYIADVYMSGKGYLPKEFTDFVKLKFREKTELKGVDDYYYMKAKNIINSLYGMAVTSIDNELITYDQETKEYIHEKEPLEEVLRKHYKNRNQFLPYQIGVFCTAFARAQLREMLNLIGRDVVYCDTDSVKFIGEHNLEKVEDVNRNLRERAENFGCFAKDRKGNIKYMGIWEYEGKYKEFRHIGAKRYIYSEEGKTGYFVTIAGVNKKRGREHFSKVGIDRFTNGEVIKNAGHLVAYYNDDDIYTLDIGYRKITTASNVALVDDTYTLGWTDDYLHIMEEARKGGIALA